MLYSTYRIAVIAAWVVILGLTGVVGLLINVGFGLAVLILGVLVGLMVLPLHFELLGHRLREHNGVFPNPSFGLGMWGFDIHDDRPPLPEVNEAAERQGPRPICPTCRTVAVTASAKYCHECGTPFSRTPVASPSW